jgi:very-short-patch-repair endonuclease
LRSRQVAGVKFRRQEEIEEYVVDFVCYEKKLVIELDGGQHSINIGYDRCKDRCLRANGYTVLRFWDNDVFKNLAGVLEVIRRHCL